jgi:hypothetical protein
MKSCSSINFIGLDGFYRHPFYIEASCIWSGFDYIPRTQLDLNTCFGWSYRDCSFGLPSVGNFTDSCSKCEAHMDPRSNGTIDCQCLCHVKDPSKVRVTLSKCINLLVQFSQDRRSMSLLTETLSDDHIANYHGFLTC